MQSMLLRDAKTTHLSYEEEDTCEAEHALARRQDHT